MTNKQHVAVLMGGWSSEREVSLASGAACAKAARLAELRPYFHRIKLAAGVTNPG